MVKVKELHPGVLHTRRYSFFFSKSDSGTKAFTPSPLEFIFPFPFDRPELNLGQLHAGSVVLQPAIYLIPRLYRASTGRRTGQDHITFLKEWKGLATGPGRGCKDHQDVDV